MANEPMLDTDICIEFLRGRAEAVEFIDQLGFPYISIVTVAELYGGVREGKERKSLEVFIENSAIININTEIAVKGGLYRRDYGRSHGVGFADSLIAATAETEAKTLVTFNKKHFPMLPSVTVPYVR